MTRPAHPRKYEWQLVIFFFVTWGLVFLDRLAVAYLAPTLVGVFRLNNAQVGMLGTVSTLCYAVATILFSLVAHRISRPKRNLLLLVFATALAAASCSLVRTYGQLLIARGLLGALEGPILPLIMLLVNKAASEKSLGLDSGVINLGVVVMAIILGPVLITQVLAIAAWQMAFLSYSLPLLGVGFLLLFLVREVVITSPDHPQEPSRAGVSDNVVSSLLGYRNIRACSVVSIVAMSGYWCIMLYAPLYLTTVTRMSMQTMGFIASVMGLAMVIYAVMIPKLSDIYGRKPILTLFLLLPAAGTLLMALLPGTGISTAAYVVFGGILGCVMPVYAIIIPLETVPDHLKASANSLVIGLGEIIGGAFFPLIAGSLADAVGLPSMMGVASGLLLLGAVASLFVLETLSAKTTPRGALHR